MHKAKVLIVDDDPAILGTLHEYLEIEGYNVVEAADLRSARQALENGFPDVAITDFDLPDGDALDFLNFVKTMNVAMKTIVLTGAMIPYAFGSSDGLFNLGSALSLVQVLKPGIYIAMNGRHFEWSKVRKNRETGVFEAIS